MMTSAFNQPVHAAVPWIRSGVETQRQVWGIQGGVLVAIWPDGVEGKQLGGPRGLFRVGYQTEGDMGRLINFVANEPIVAPNRRGLSELEISRCDGQKGKVFAPALRQGEPFDLERLKKQAAKDATPSPGWIDHPDPRRPEVERLNVEFLIEPFNNGGHSRVTVSIRSDRPEEAAFRAEAEPDSAPIKSYVFSATMGNYIRARWLWLAGRTATAGELWPDYAGDDFAPPKFFDRGQLISTPSSDVLAAITTDEDNPGAVIPKAAPNWKYRAEKRTQYWRVPKGEASPGIRAKVNGRRVYWASHNPLPGGIAFENFELNDAFNPRESFIFGITKKTPEELNE
ncbi:MAG: hypothetical protein NTW86_10290 [Candidatus Sumerlaeota bacterium]|nr:hypothetical protein [Candidatus Sumerlaeota bacterium]